MKVMQLPKCNACSIVKIYRTKDANAAVNTLLTITHEKVLLMCNPAHDHELAAAGAAVISRASWSPVWMYATSAAPARAPMNLSWS
jgi:hypothetical protein